jgi:hypothetical protein
VEEPYQPIEGFLQHPNSKSGLVVQFSDHLSVDTLQAFVEFENSVRSATADQIEGALLRYKRFMYLQKQYPDSIFIPTRDIEMVWRSHCLRPSAYMRDCEVNFGKIMAHPSVATVALLEMSEQALLITMELWKQHFGTDYLENSERYVSPRLKPCMNRDTWFENVLAWENVPKDDEKIDIQISLSKDEVLADRTWFKQLDKAMKLNVLHNSSRLWSSILKSYERYLFMYLITPEEKLANPTVFIDLAWHNHMIDPQGYIKDMNRIVGHVVDHDPTLVSTDERISSTSSAWEKQFGVNYKQEHEFVRLLPKERLKPMYVERRNFKKFQVPVTAFLDSNRERKAQ